MRPRNLAILFFFAFTEPCLVAAQPVPDDGIDDRQAIQDHLDAWSSLDLPCGTFDVSPNPGGGQAGIAALNLRGEMALRGAGACTVLHFTGSPSGDWRGVREYGNNNLLADLTVDTSDLVTGDEQSHALEVVGNSTFGPADGNVIRDLWVVHPFTGTISGDCLRLLGEDSYRVTRTLVSDVHFLACKRSAVAIQRGVYDWSITDSSFIQSTDQIIDGEQSGSAHNGRGIIANSMFFTTTGKYAVAMSGVSTANLVIEGNTFIGQGLSCRSCQGLVLSDNLFFHDTPSSADATVSLARDTTDVVMTGNWVMRDAGTGGPVLSVTNDGALAPARVRVVGNTFVQGTDAVGVNVTSATRFAFQDNLVELGAGLTGPHGVKLWRNSSNDQLNDSVMITANLFTGPWQIAVTLQNTGRATLGFNSADATPGAKGLSCNGSVTGPVVSAANNWTASSCSIATSGSI